jgi:hypothetical protein
MGAVLEMTRLGLALAASLVLVGCGGNTTGTADSGGSADRVIGIVSQIGRLGGGVRSDDQVDAQRSVPGGFAPEAITAEPQAYRFVQVNALNLQEPARIIQQNGDEVTLALQSGPTAAFDRGILVATRGFGDDLMTIDSANVLEVLQAGGGTLTRRAEMLDNQDQLLTDSFACTITSAGSEEVNLGLRTPTLRRFDENCKGEALIFDNIYWLDGTGNILASRQYVSPTVAYLRANVL